MSLAVIGTGFGRTGTLSLKGALEKLGFGRCYQRTEHPMSVRGHQHVVFDTHPADAGQIDTRLDRDHHVGLQLFLRAPRQRRSLVNGQAQAVTQPVAEVLAVTAPFDVVNVVMF